MDLNPPFSGQTVVKDFAGTHAELEACLRLRYRYFVEERAWVPADATRPGVECDGYDAHALHLSLWDEEGVVAYLRALPHHPQVGFMLDRELSCLLTEGERRQLPREGAMELSRLVVRPDLLLMDGKQPHPIEMLLKRLYRIAKQRDFTRFHVVVEQDWLFPFARRFGLPFRVIGAPQTFPDGTRTVAATATLAELEAGICRHSAKKYAWYQED